jgi:SAM-dependent methyltransferase
MATLYDPTWVRRFYNDYGMKEWNRWERDALGRVKWLVHVHYLRQYLPAGLRVLEVGAGAGRFTQVLAELTPHITVADISSGQLELNRQQAEALGFDQAVERRVECDMSDLHGVFTDEEFDAVVCLGGPVSYLFDRAADGIRELMHVTKPGGPIFLEVMTLWGIIHEMLFDALKLDPAVNLQIVASGDLTPPLGVSTHYCRMYRAAEFRRLLEGIGLPIELMFASNVLTATWGEKLKEISEDSAAWAHLMAMELQACREPGCLDMGTHLVAVCRKA